MMTVRTFLPSFNKGRRLLFQCAVSAAVLVMAGVSPLAQAAPGGVANLAMVAEPQTLDPMASTTDLVATIMQHVYEPLYTFDAKWAIQPMLAESLPKVSADGKTVTIELRKGVKFHNGKEMKSDDVVASLKRWMDIAPRGKAVSKEIKSLDAKGPYTIVLNMQNAYAPLLAHLALPSGFAAIMPKESVANPLKDFIGTGPYQFKERKPDQYVLLTRFDGYSARKEAASGYAGKREALLSELRFIPVPNPNTRVEGSLSGQYQFADLLPAEASPRLAGKSNVVPVITAPFGFPYVVLNTVQGPLQKQGVRQAIQAALNMKEIMTAGFGDPKFFSVEGNHFPKGSPFYSMDGVASYNQANPAKARDLAAKAGYKGEPIKILTSKQYEFHYRMALVMGEELKLAGFKVDMQVVDWATLIQRRNDMALWDIYMTHSAFLPEPTLSPPQLSDGAPGGWKSAGKDVSVTVFSHEMDPTHRGALWGKVQSTVYDEVPYIRLGSFNSLTARSAKLQGYVPMPWPYFWNTKLAD
jgi:peptide/nickel transport system substrate-binding protein